MPIYDCGCENQLDEKWGVLRSISKCDFHRQWSLDHPQGENLEYYKTLLCVDERGIPQNQRYVKELVEGLDLNDLHYLSNGKNKVVVELGAGLGMYTPLFLMSDWHYNAVERSAFACDWIANTFCVPVFNFSVEYFLQKSQLSCHCIFAAHIFEHLQDAPRVIQQCFERVMQRLYLIVPDDSDPVNPDHLWFFNQDSLHALLEKTGFKKVRSQIKKVVPHENFIYCVAEK